MKMQINLDKNDGALVFRQSGEVEVTLPKMNTNDPLPKHLWPLVVLIDRLRDRDFIKNSWEDLTEKMRNQSE
jgi:hypothetical protein